LGRPAVVPPAGRGGDRMPAPAGALGAGGGRWGAFSQSAEERCGRLRDRSPTGGRRIGDPADWVTAQVAGGF
jgi:hypothetical protein